MTRKLVTYGLTNILLAVLQFEIWFAANILAYIGSYFPQRNFIGLSPAFKLSHFLLYRFPTDENGLVHKPSKKAADRAIILTPKPFFMFMGLPRMKFISGNFVRSTAFSYTVKITLGSFLYSLFMELSFFNKVEDAGVTNLVY